MERISLELNKRAEEACVFLSKQLNKLSSVMSVEDAKVIMREVCDYAFPQINCYALFTPLIRCIRIDKENEEPSSITQMFESYAQGLLNNQNSPLKDIKSDKDDNINIMDPTWVRKWEEETEQYLVLSLENGDKVQMEATIHSDFSTDGVEPEMVFGFNAD